MKFKTTIIGLLTAGALAITGAGVANAADAQEVTSLAQANTQSEFKQVLGAINAGLVTDADNKPAYSYQRAVSLGVNKNLANELNELYLEAKASGDAYVQANWWACTVELGKLVLFFAPIGKLFKAAGGIAKLVRLILSGKMRWESFLALLGGILGVDELEAVRKACFV